MNHNQPIRPAIYVRASSKGRVGTGAIASQVDALRARIRQDDLVLEGSFGRRTWFATPSNLLSYGRTDSAVCLATNKQHG